MDMLSYLPGALVDRTAHSVMADSPSPEEQQAVRQLVAQFAAQFPETALAELAIRLLSLEAARSRWEALLAEVVACAVYNQISLEQAEEIIVRPLA